MGIFCFNLVNKKKTTKIGQNDVAIKANDFKIDDIVYI
jgi:hypothetical protein